MVESLFRNILMKSGGGGSSEEFFKEQVSTRVGQVHPGTLRLGSRDGGRRTSRRERRGREGARGDPARRAFSLANIIFLSSFQRN